MRRYTSMKFLDFIVHGCSFFFPKIVIESFPNIYFLSYYTQPLLDERLCMVGDGRVADGRHANVAC